MKISKSRLPAALKRSARAHILRKSGGTPGTVQACGANKVALWGSACNGLPDQDLHLLRCAAVKSAVRMSPGQSAAATLRALAASGKHKSLDPAVGHHRQVIISWASCVWEGLPTLDIMQRTLEQAVAKLRTYKKPWQGVTDPAGAFILTLGELGLSAASARQLFIEKG